MRRGAAPGAGARRPTARGPLAAAIFGVLAASTAGCGLLADSDATTSAPGQTLAPLTSTTRVVVGQHEVATRCAGATADPSVLLVSGYDTELSQSWDDVQPAIGAFARVCAYDRLGVGDSDEPPERRSFADLADEVDGVIDALGLTRPVVVVAHSLGGVVAVTWAEEHRQDLAGLVLVDATPPSFVATALATLPKDPAERGGELRSQLGSLLRPTANSEHLAGRSAFDPPTVFSPVGSQPVVVLTHSISEWGDLRPRDAAAMDSAWVGGQQAWAELSIRGEVQIVDRAGHDIQRDRPDVVVDAVRRVVDDS